MTKRPRYKPMRFIVTGALLIGPALQGCDRYYDDEPTNNEIAPPVVEAPVPNEMEDPPPLEETAPPEETSPPEVAAEDPGIDPPIGESAMGTGGLVIMGTNAVAPTTMRRPEGELGN